LNKLVLFFFGLLLGGMIVYVIGDFFPRIIIQHTTIKNENKEVKDSTEVSNKKNKKGKGSLVESIESPPNTNGLNSENIENDTIMPFVLDTTFQTDSQYEVVRDRQIGKKTVIIQQYNTAKDTSATAKIADKVGEEISFNRNMLVEFWESPIDFLGYKLSKNKLIFYGIPPQEQFELIYKDTESISLIINEKTITLKKTEKYKSITL